jgi:hypothetical protein
MEPKRQLTPSLSSVIYPRLATPLNAGVRRRGDYDSDDDYPAFGDDFGSDSGRLMRDCRGPGIRRALPEKDRAARLIGLSGGADQVLSRALYVLAGGEFQWAAELADYVLAVDSGNVDAKKNKAQALTELGERQINATARNYYLSSARYLLRDIPPH